MRLPVQSPNVIETNPMGFGMDADMSAWDNLSPFQTYLADSFAKGAKNRGLLDQRMKRALMGETLEEQDQTDFQKKAAENAFQLAQEAADMDDAEYEDLKRQLKGMVAQRPQMPGMPKLQTPNAAALGVAGIGALLNPQFGAQIAATPFQEGLRQQEQGYQQSMLGYEDELAKRQEQMRFLESQMDDARADRQTRINAAIKLAELTESARQFQVTEDNKLAIAGMNNTTKAAANRTATLKAILAKVPAEARAEVIGAMGLGFDAEALQAMSELNEAEKNLKAKTETEGYKQRDINNRIYWRDKETPAKIQNMLASKGLKEAQTKRITKITSMLDDEFALKYATAMGRLAVAQQNAGTYANSKNKVDTGATLNEMRLLLNSQLDALTGQLALSDDDAERESIQFRIKAVTDELLGLTKIPQEPQRGMNVGAPGFGLMPGADAKFDQEFAKAKADWAQIPKSMRKAAAADLEKYFKETYKRNVSFK